MVALILLIMTMVVAVVGWEICMSSCAPPAEPPAEE